MAGLKSTLVSAFCVCIVIAIGLSSISGFNFELKLDQTESSESEIIHSLAINASLESNCSVSYNHTSETPIVPPNEGNQSEARSLSVPEGLPPSMCNGSQDLLVSPLKAPQQHWYYGADYAGAQFLAHSVSCYITTPSAYDVASEFYYVILSVWDDGTSYDQFGLASNNGQWTVVWSWTSPNTTRFDGCDYHGSNNAYTLARNTEYQFLMTLAAGGTLTYSLLNSVGVVLWSLSQNVGGDSNNFVINSSFYNYAGNYGQGLTMIDFTDYVEAWNMEPTIRSPSFNWDFTSTSADGSYVNNWELYGASDSFVYVPEWMHVSWQPGGFVEVWSGLNKITDFTDSSPNSVACGVRWEDDSVWLAWSGTSNNYLNVIKTTDIRTWGSKYTSSQTSPYGPSITWTHEFSASHLVMAWIGSGSSNYVNTMRSTDGSTWTNVLTMTSFPKSNKPPSLAFDTNNNVLYLAYKSTASSNNIVILRSTDDAVSWSQLATVAQTTVDAPAIAWGVNCFYLAFVSASNYLTVMKSTDCITWTNKETLQDKMSTSSALALGMTCTTDGLSLSWYDYATSMASFRRSAGGDTRWWGGKVSLPFGTFYGAVSMCGLPKPDRYVAWTSGSDKRINLLKIIWDPQGTKYGTIDGFVDGFEDSTAFSDNWVAVYGTPHTTTAQHHRGSYSYEMSSDQEAIQHMLPILKGRFEVWMYDPGWTVAAGREVVVTQSATGGVAAIGFMSDIMGLNDKYIYYDGVYAYNTLITRTAGWHCIQIVADGTNSIGYIDGTTVFTNTWVPRVQFLKIWDAWADGIAHTTVAFDDLSFSTDYATGS